MKPSIVQKIEQIGGGNLNLQPTPDFPQDPDYPDAGLVSLMAFKARTPKYLLDESGNLIGLNLAASGLTDDRWQHILAILNAEEVRLRALNLNENNLTAFPPDRGLRELVYLDLSENKLSEIEMPPGSSSLREIALFENPLTSPPPDIVKLGKAEILKWLKSENKRPVLEAKIMFIGDSNFGKTHLIEMLKNNQLSREITTTHGIERSRIQDAKSADGQVRLNVWDLGGQQFMRSTHQFFFTERTLYVLVTVARRERKDLNHWLQLVHEIGEDAPVLVVINKTDLDDHDIDRAPLQREYPNIVGFVRTAVFDNPEKGIVALDTIHNLKTAIHRIVTDPELMPSVFVEQREEWFTVKNELESLKEEFISFERYQSLPHICNLPEEEQRLNLKQLSWLGTIISFVDDPRLVYMNVINPKWIMDGVYSLINDSEVKDERRGLFSFSDFNRLLDKKRYPGDKYSFLVELMKKFRLCYPVNTKADTFLLPDLFSDIEPEGVWREDKDNMRFRLNYGNYPPDLFITQFIVERYSNIFEDKRWRSGVVIGDGQCKAIVRRAVANEFIEIEVSGPINLRRSYLHLILDVFRELHEPYEKLKVIREVPYKNVWLNYDHLLKYEESGNSYYHPELDEMIPVAELLNGYGRPSGKNLEEKILEKLEHIEQKQDYHIKLTKKTNKKLDEIRFDQQQILAALEHDKIPINIQNEVIDAIQPYFEKLETLFASNNQKSQAQAVKQIRYEPEVKSKLKLTIPLIPFMVNYETELGWDWQKVKKSLVKIIP